MTTKNNHVSQKNFTIKTFKFYMHSNGMIPSDHIKWHILQKNLRQKLFKLFVYIPMERSPMTA